MWYWIGVEDKQWLAQLEVGDDIHYQMCFMEKQPSYWEIDYWPIAVTEVDQSTAHNIDEFTNIDPNYKWDFNPIRLFRLMANTMDDFIINNHPHALTAFTQNFREPQKKLHLLLARHLERKYKGNILVYEEDDSIAGRIERVVVKL
jgi:hypothetical protein